MRGRRAARAVRDRHGEAPARPPALYTLRLGNGRSLRVTLS